jgi:hypothetical protein
MVFLRRKTRLPATSIPPPNPSRQRFLGHKGNRRYLRARRQARAGWIIRGPAAVAAARPAVAAAWDTAVASAWLAFPALRICSLLDAEQRGNFFTRVLEHVGGRVAGELWAALRPGEIAYMVGEDNAGDGVAFGDWHFEGIALGAVGDGTHDAQIGALVIAPRAYDQGGPPPPLFVSSGWIEIDPDNVALVWAILFTRPRCRRVAPSPSLGGGFPR